MKKSGFIQNRFVLAFLVVLAIICCISVTSDWKELDLDVFKISVPNEWIYQKEQSEDSFIGKIIAQNLSLNFDYSNLGYANHLIPTESEYLKKGEWLRDCPLYKVGVTYIAAFNVKKEKISQMKEKGITDSSLVKVEADPCFEAKKYIHEPTIKQKNKFAKADYIADLTYRGDTVFIPIEIPAAIKNHNIKIDTTEKYIIKTIWPKLAGNGITGIYIHSRKSSFNFQMNGKNLSLKDQNIALQAFKTIKFKD